MNWLETKYLYLGLLEFTISFPLAASFDYRFKYFKKWKYLWRGILLLMVIFIPWDIWFTYEGVWWFNEEYVSGITLFLLPLEEWLFFIIIPFSCVFIYEAINFYLKKNPFEKTARGIFMVIASVLAILSVIFHQHLYTLVVCITTLMAIVFLVYQNPTWMGRFLLMYLISWIPFLLVNGALTGWFTKRATVNYDPQEFMGVRIFSIPIEDSIYNLCMLLTVVYVYEWSRYRVVAN